MKKPWDSVKARLLDEAFYGHDAAILTAEQDLPRSGLLDSLAMVVVVEILADMSENESVLMEARQSDLRSFESIRALYDRL